MTILIKIETVKKKHQQPEYFVSLNETNTRQLLGENISSF